MRDSALQFVTQVFTHNFHFIGTQAVAARERRSRLPSYDLIIALLASHIEINIHLRLIASSSGLALLLSVFALVYTATRYVAYTNHDLYNITFTRLHSHYRLEMLRGGSTDLRSLFA